VSTRFVDIGARADFARGSIKAVEVGGRTVAVFDIGGSLFAVADECTHSGGPLSEGEVEAGVVTCPWHGARFELSSGRNVGDLKCPAVRAFPIREVGGRVEIEAAD